MWIVEQVPFLNLSDGTFVLFYAVFAALILGISWLVLKACDRTSVRALPPVPSDPDPIEIAHLAGGENNVLRLVLYNLLQRGLIAIDAGSRLCPAQIAAHPGHLTLLEEHVLAAARSSSRAKDVFEDASLRSTVRDRCAPLRAQLEAQQLLVPRNVHVAGKRVLRIGLITLVGPLLCNELYAWSQGTTNILALLIPAVLVCTCLATVVEHVTDAWLSKRGRAYLERVRFAYSGVKTESLSGNVNGPGVPEQSTRAVNSAFALLIGLYGFEILLGTADASIAKAFHVGSDASAAACGAGCGGAGCGGCGGCGG